VENDRATLGRNIHSIIAEYYANISQKPTAKQVETMAMACFDSGFEQSLKSYKKEAEEMIRNFIKFEQSRLASYIKPILVEKKLENDNFTGIVDYFDGTNIIDWKTGAVMEIDDDMRRQGKIYDVLLKSNGYNSSHRIYFITLSNGRSLELPLTTEAWLMEQVKRMYSMVENQRFPKCRSGLCNYCEVMLECQMEGVTLWSES